MRKTIAAFDFDGTITTSDILIPFLIQVFGRWKVNVEIAKLLPSLLQFGLGTISRQEMKERFLTRLIKGMPLPQFCSLAETFSETKLPSLIRKEALERLEWHKEQGHIVVIISANLAPLLSHFAKKNDTHALLASQLGIDKRMELTGKLEGLNCWGAEKTTRLIAAFGPKENYTLYAYGDSRGDKELLELADYPHYRYF